MLVPVKRSMHVKQWNFRKAKWSHYIALTNKFAKNLLPPDSLDVDAAYQDLCNTIKKAAKKTIPREYRNNYEGQSKNNEPKSLLAIFVAIKSKVIHQKKAQG